MPIFATFLYGMFQTLVVIFTRFAAFGTAVRLASWTTFTIFVAALYVTAKACHDTVCGPIVAGAASLHPMVGMGLGLVFNNKTVGIFGCYLTLWMLCELFTHRRFMLHTIMGVKI